MYYCVKYKTEQITFSRETVTSCSELGFSDEVAKYIEDQLYYYGVFDFEYGGDSYTIYEVEK